MKYRGWGAVVESGCKGIYNDQNQYFLDLTTISYDISSFVRVGIPSTNLKFVSICDILGYHKFSKAWFFADYLN